ncbi:hypothetical protein cypCar_00030062 [Cyprinus carpio]|nr:hypothetical protein cypCar_00030062 [Cyprinus carpio]
MCSFPHQTREDTTIQGCVSSSLFRGQVPAEAENNYLAIAKTLEMYGVDLHPVFGEKQSEYFLGLTPVGVVVYKNKTQVGKYFW